MIVLVITGAAVTLLLIGEAVPTLRGDVVLVADAEQQYGENVSIVNVTLIIIIMMSFRYLWHLYLINPKHVDIVITMLIGLFHLISIYSLWMTFNECPWG